MNIHAKLSVILLFFFFAKTGQSQTPEEKALEKGQAAVKLEDEGKYEDALTLLHEAEKLDPENYNYPYEIGYTYSLQKEYGKAIEEYKKVVKFKSATDQCFQMLGNIYDMQGDSANALKAFRDGLKHFPKSGRLFLEEGNVYWARKAYNAALPFYEQGIEAEPAFASNYYRATLLYCSSSESVWGMLYGELFINLEKGTERTEEISKLLYKTYKKAIQFTSDTSTTVSFSKNNYVSIESLKDPNKMKLPFGIGAYEPCMLMAVSGEKNTDLNALDRIRTRFVQTYFKTGNNSKYPNALFDFQDKILKAGHLEAYNHWLLLKGDEEGFKTWEAANKEKWDAFAKWFPKNGIQLDDTHKFYRMQY